MITEQDLQEAIAECQGTKNPTSSTCIKLAAFLTIREHLFGGQIKDEPLRYSYSAEPDAINYSGKTEFADLINGRRQSEVMPVIEELVEAVHALNPRLYASVVRKLS